MEESAGRGDSPGVAMEVGKMKSSMFIRSEEAGEFVSSPDSRSCAIPEGALAACCWFSLEQVTSISQGSHTMTPENLGMVTPT